ncbi:MAG: hypothetical protein H8D23_28040 [Candidatus Brocadiales bacterium]|nr:hypothetical protein [Candidatus Brocadiales bacterium]
MKNVREIVALRVINLSFKRMKKKRVTSYGLRVVREDNGTRIERRS